MKKKICICISILSAVLLLGLLVCYGSIRYVHFQILQSAHSYEETRETKSGYTLITYVETDDPVPLVTFKILDENQNLVFQPDGRWRATDLKSIAFSDDSLDVLVDSADVGAVIYYYGSCGWKKR